jgi:hypothetical protein
VDCLDWDDWSCVDYRHAKALTPFTIQQSQARPPWRVTHHRFSSIVDCRSFSSPFRPPSPPDATESRTQDRARHDGAAEW